MSLGGREAWSEGVVKLHHIDTHEGTRYIYYTQLCKIHGYVLQRQMFPKVCFVADVCIQDHHCRGGEVGCQQGKEFHQSQGIDFTFNVALARLGIHNSTGTIKFGFYPNLQFLGKALCWFPKPNRPGLPSVYGALCISGRRGHGDWRLQTRPYCTLPSTGRRELPPQGGSGRERERLRERERGR